MRKQVEAVYENGVLRPLQPLPLEEHERVIVTVSFRPGKERPFWEIAGPEERVAAWKEWVNSHPSLDGTGLPDEALRRENMYE